MSFRIPASTRPDADSNHTRHARGRSARMLGAALMTSALVMSGFAVLAPHTAAAASGVVNGTVYRDLDDDGVRDAREPGVAGVVIDAGSVSTLTDAQGRWSMRTGGIVRLDVSTGWYRSQCDSTNCAAGPGRHQDFDVVDQAIVAPRVNASAGATLDLGLLPDWRGTYPVPSAPVPSNPVDVAARVSWSATNTGTCGRTNQTCSAGDKPQFTLQILNEGTTTLTDPSGYIQLPAGVTIASVAPSSAPATHPAMTRLNTNAPDATGRVWFVARGNLPPAAAGVFTMTLRVGSSSDANRAAASGPVAVGLRVTSVNDDRDGDTCSAGATNCAWGTANKQVSPDNSNTVSMSIVTAAPPTTQPPTTTLPATTAPATTVPATTVPATTSTTTVPTTTVPPTTSTTSTTTTSTTTTVPRTTVPPTTVPPTTSTPTTSPPPSSCTVSTLLVPSCGAWLGSSTESLDGTYNLMKGLGEYEAVAQNTPDIVHVYKKGNVKFPSASDIALSERPGKARSLLLINWKPSVTVSWRQVADGGADAAIATVASGLKAYNHKMFLTIFHEPENDVQSAGSGYTPADYVAMYRYVVTKLRAAGVTNAVYVYNAMGYEGWSTIQDALYPGSDVVDWIAYDPYAEAPHKTMALMLNWTSKSSWPGFYSWATAKAPGKPIMLGEWGFSLNKQPLAPQALDNAVPVLKSQFPMLKAFVYWNNHFDDGFEVRLDQPTELGRAYGAAYGRFANNAYFNSTQTSAAD